jgi:hypothetical protein
MKYNKYMYHIIYMSSIQIYYVCSDLVKKNTLDLGIDLDSNIQIGNRSLDQIYNEIKNDPYFCRGEESISYNHFLSLIRNDISLYASLDDRVVGVLNFIFNERDGERIINFNGICSPIKCSGKSVGKELIHTLIILAKQTNSKYIYLECKGEIVNYYCDKFGFEIMSSKMSYDSDENDDEEASYYDQEGPYHFMRLDLSEVIIENKTTYFEETNKEENDK